MTFKSKVSAGGVEVPFQVDGIGKELDAMRRCALKLTEEEILRLNERIAELKGRD